MVASNEVFSSRALQEDKLTGLQTRMENIKKKDSE